MDTTKTILGVLLAGSVILNVLFWYNPSMFSTCYSTPGYSEPEMIGKVTAQRYVAEYKNSLPAWDDVTGGIITRSAFDEMMCLETCNAISYTFAREKDATGKLSGVFVVFNGVNVTVEPDKLTVRDIGSPFYITRQWCPPNCYIW